MGYVAEPTPEMGEYSVEIRSESFYLHGEDNYTVTGIKACPGPPACDVVDVHRHAPLWDVEKKPHGIYLYPVREGFPQGTAEFLIEDIHKIRAALDQVERHIAGKTE